MTKQSTQQKTLMKNIDMLRYAAVSGKSKQPFSTEDWASFSERNLGLAKKAIGTALHLQSSVDVILARNAANLKTQKDLSDRAFNRYTI